MALPEVHLLVATLGPSTNHKYNAGLEKLNAAIPNIVSFEQAQGHHIKLVGLNSVLRKNDIVKDQIHPTQQDYDEMAEKWATAIKLLLNHKDFHVTRSKGVSHVSYPSLGNRWG